MEKQTYDFSEISYQQAQYAFKLQKQKDFVFMTKWLEKAKHQIITNFEKTLIQSVQEDLIESNNSWNEQELLVQFIAPILSLVKFNQLDKHFAVFSERWLTATFENNTFQGKVDWMVATGRHDPIQPFFFLHEYKKSLETPGDPAGQLLTTMYTAQILNHQKKKPTLFNPHPITHENWPIYGCYIIGNSWYFLVLKDHQYFISTPYLAVIPEHLYQVIKLLKAQKQLILEYVDSLEQPLVS